ncbi:MAG: inhibitor of KinA [Clostridiales bacterium]|jgi:KipI family sensor histidine kinase inhibitor|nr:inhibitor of KinA [Clostridiales bacterium]MDK2932240.1 inhibitor of KinA [Clostridiales bacterium]
MYTKAKYILAGDQYIVIEFGDTISIDIHKKVRGLYLTLQQYDSEKVVEVIPTYRSLLVQYNPLMISASKLINEIQVLEENLKDLQLPKPKIFKIPVLYGEEFGPDLDFVAQHNRLTPQEVIDIHSGRDYLIYMLGFTPGFCYLGGMSKKIVTPRLKEPRTCIPAGSVGIADKQTGIYPIDSPGGWRLIGRTPIKLFDPQNEVQPILLKAGDYIRYYSITRDEYKQISKAVDEGIYQVEILEE